MNVRQKRRLCSSEPTRMASIVLRVPRVPGQPARRSLRANNLRPGKDFPPDILSVFAAPASESLPGRGEYLTSSEGAAGSKRMKILNRIEGPGDLKGLSHAQLRQLAKDCRG